jgi:hypothetical protein
MYSDFFFDPKIVSLSFAEQRHYLFVLCMKNDGLLDKKYPKKEMLDSVVSKRLGLIEEEFLNLKKKFLNAGLIDDRWQPVYWDRFRHESNRPASNIWKVIREFIFARDNYTCQYCGERGKRLECDHVVPVSKGGSHDNSNLVTACFKCNRSKRDKLISEWRAS